MTNKFKTLLKTTAAVATLMAGSQTWGAGTAALYGEDTADYTGADRTISTQFAVFASGLSANGTGVDVTSSRNITLTKDNTEVFFVTGGGGDSSSGKITLTGRINATKGSKFYFTGGLDSTISGATFVGPLSGSSYLVLATAGKVTIPGTLDPTKYKIISKTTGSLDLGANGANMYEMNIESGTLTLGSANTSLVGKVYGSGSLTLDSATTLVHSDLSKLSGTVTAAAATTFAVPPQNLSNGAFAATINSAGTIKKLTISADASTIKAGGNLVIEELALNGTLTLACDTGVTITVKKITGALTKAITLAGKSVAGSGGGTFVITIGDYTGTFTESAGTLVRK